MSLMCTDCGQPYKANAGHCRGGPYEGCCSSFATVRGFDAHRTGKFGERRCLSIAERRELGWRQDDVGYWRSPADDRDAERIRLRRNASRT